MSKRKKARLIFWAADVLVFLYGIANTLIGINGFKMLDASIMHDYAVQCGYTGEFGTMMFNAFCMLAGVGGIIGSIVMAAIFVFALKVHTFSDED